MLSGEFPFQLGPTACGTFMKHSTKPFPLPDAPHSMHVITIFGNTYIFTAPLAVPESPSLDG